MESGSDVGGPPMLANEPAQEILQPNAEGEDGGDIFARARAEGAGYLNGRAGFTALGKRNGVGAALICEAPSRCAFGGVEC